MTRDFNKPKRDNSSPSFRNSSPNRSRDERSPRPARPRLNRETVDRAWESGAQQQHADYRPRTGGGQNRYQGQQQRTNDRRDTSSNQHSTPYGRNNGNNRPYSNRQDNYSDSRNRRNTQPGNSNRSYNDNAPRSSYGQERRSGGEQRFSDRRDSFRSENRRDDENRRNSFYSENRRGTENRQSFRDRDSRDDFRRNDRPNSFRDRPQREESRPRWQSRPGEQRNNTRGAERNFNRRPNTDGEQFEGDYEYVERRNNSSTRDTRPTRPAERPFRGSDSSAQERSRKPLERNRSERPSRRFDDHDNDVQPERHVTRLPDGRVLKGSRPAQRKNAKFWTDISQNTGELLDAVADTVPTQQTTQEKPEENVVDAPVAQEVLPTADEPTEDAAEQQETSSTEALSATARKRRARSASAVTRGKKTTSSSALKPSQRGFKWPTQS